MINLALLEHLPPEAILKYREGLNQRIKDLKFLKPYSIIKGDKDSWVDEQVGRLVLSIVNDRIEELEMERMLIGEWMRKNGSC